MACTCGKCAVHTCGQPLDAMLFGETPQPAKIEALHTRAADNDTAAMIELGWAHSRGHYGASKDHVLAAQWYTRAAALGSAEGALNMGDLADLGYGVPKDAGVSFTWYLQAAEGGSARAQFNTMINYERGLGTAEDAAAAREWGLRAAEQGHEGALEHLRDHYGVTDADLGARRARAMAELAEKTRAAADDPKRICEITTELLEKRLAASQVAECEAAIAAGLPTAIAAAMLRFPHAFELQLAGCNALGALARAPPCRLALATADGVAAALVAVVRAAAGAAGTDSPDPQVQGKVLRAALCAVQEIAGKGDNDEDEEDEDDDDDENDDDDGESSGRVKDRVTLEQALYNAGAIPTLITAVQGAVDRPDLPADTVFVAMSALGGILGSAASRQCCLDADGTRTMLRALERLLQAPVSAATNRALTATMQTLMRQTCHKKSQPVELDPCLPIIVDLMKARPTLAELQAAACAVVSRAAECASTVPALLSSTMHTAALAVLTSMQGHLNHKKIQSFGCKMLTNFALAGADENLALRTILQDGAGAAVATAISSNRAIVRRNAARTTHTFIARGFAGDAHAAAVVGNALLEAVRGLKSELLDEAKHFVAKVPGDLLAVDPDASGVAAALCTILALVDPQLGAHSRPDGKAALEDESGQPHNKDDGSLDEESQEGVSQHEKFKGEEDVGQEGSHDATPAQSGDDDGSSISNSAADGEESDSDDASHRDFDGHGNGVQPVEDDGHIALAGRILVRLNAASDLDIENDAKDLLTLREGCKLLHTIIKHKRNAKSLVSTTEIISTMLSVLQSLALVINSDDCTSAANKLALSALDAACGVLRCCAVACGRAVLQRIGMTEALAALFLASEPKMVATAVMPLFSSFTTKADKVLSFLLQYLPSPEAGGILLADEMFCRTFQEQMHEWIVEYVITPRAEWPQVEQPPAVVVISLSALFMSRHPVIQIVDDGLKVIESSLALLARSKPREDAAAREQSAVNWSELVQCLVGLIQNHAAVFPSYIRPFKLLGKVADAPPAAVHMHDIIPFLYDVISAANCEPPPAPRVGAGVGYMGKAYDIVTAELSDMRDAARCLAVVDYTAVMATVPAAIDWPQLIKHLVTSLDRTNGGSAVLSDMRENIVRTLTRMAAVPPLKTAILAADGSAAIERLSHAERERHKKLCELALGALA
eukprot:m.198301 g.198301  ORF g.198301 m.198301 type:complete len:1179 (+) comp10094_c0_seq2:2214-5750(+)